MIKRGDIVLIKYPYTDLSSGKVRPALVISSDKFMQTSQNAVFLPISSNTDNPHETEILISKEDPDFPSTGLLESSVIKTEIILTLEKKLATRMLGFATTNLLDKVDALLVDVLALSKATETEPASSNDLVGTSDTTDSSPSSENAS